MAILEQGIQIEGKKKKPVCNWTQFQLQQNTRGHINRPWNLAQIYPNMDPSEKTDRWRKSGSIRQQGCIARNGPCNLKHFASQRWPWPCPTTLGICSTSYDRISSSCTWVNFRTQELYLNMQEFRLPGSTIGTKLNIGCIFWLWENQWKIMIWKEKVC